MTLLSSCGKSEQQVKEPALKEQKEPVSLLGNSKSGAPSSRSVPQEDYSALLSHESAPKSLEDVEWSVKKVNEHTEPRTAARQLRQAAAFIRAQRADADQSEKNRLNTVNKHLRIIASKFDRVKNDDEMRRVLGELQGMVGMYMP